MTGSKARALKMVITNESKNLLDMLLIREWEKEYKNNFDQAFETFIQNIKTSTIPFIYECSMPIMKF